MTTSPAVIHPGGHGKWREFFKGLSPLSLNYLVGRVGFFKKSRSRIFFREEGVQVLKISRMGDLSVGHHIPIGDQRLTVKTATPKQRPRFFYTIFLPLITPPRRRLARGSRRCSGRTGSSSLRAVSSSRTGPRPTSSVWLVRFLAHTTREASRAVKIRPKKFVS